MSVLLKKLKIDISQPIWLINEPDDAAEVLGIGEYNSTLTGKISIGQAILFVYNQAELDKYYPRLITKLADNALFWIAYPKQSSGIVSDLTRMNSNAWDSIIYSEEYTIVSSAAIDDTWTAMRIKKKDPQAKYKREVPIAERKTEGIDYIKRTVQLPEDAITAMKPFKGLEDFFNGMSFTHKKEYVESIVEAKKPETRQRRIEKMIEMVGQLKEAKENKKKR